MNFMDIVYVVLWGLLAVYCYGMAHKVSNILYLAGVFFTFLFGWNLADNLLAVDLMAGVYAWIYRGITIAFLVTIVILYAIIRKKDTE